jgi:hypothetical protein
VVKGRVRGGGGGGGCQQNHVYTGNTTTETNGNGWLLTDTRKKKKKQPLEKKAHGSVADGLLTKASALRSLLENPPSTFPS